MGSSCLFIVDKSMNFPNTELLLDEQDYQNFLFLEIKKKIMLFIILSQTEFNRNHFYKNERNCLNFIHSIYIFE